MFKKEVNRIRSWISNLIKTQNYYINIDDMDYELWTSFENNIEKIIEEMKKDINNLKENNVKYEELYKNLKDKFYYITDDALFCLSTAEYLYQYNKNSFIDYAPIVVEFSKVFEIELNNVLGYEKNKTLGQIITQSSNLIDSSHCNILDYIEEIRIIRNGSAHTGVSTEAKVDKLRKIIFESDILYKISKIEHLVKE